MSEIRYKIEYDPKIYEKLLEFPKSVINIILKNINKKLTIDPYSFGKPLKGHLRKHYRLRVGDYRVIYKIEEEKVIVLIVEIGHRKEVYEN